MIKLSALEEYDMEVTVTGGGLIRITTYSPQYEKEITFTITPRQLRLLAMMSKDLEDEATKVVVELSYESI